MNEVTIMTEKKKSVVDFNFAMYTMENTNNTSYFAAFCEQYGMTFNPPIVNQKDPLMSQVWVDVKKSLKEHGQNAMTMETLDGIFMNAKEGYDKKVAELAKEMHEKVHTTQKPVILIDHMSPLDMRMFMDITRYGDRSEMQHMMNLPVTPLAAEPIKDQEYLNFAYRMIEDIRKLDNSSMMFSTDDATFIYCGNKAVVEKMREMEKEFLKERGLAEPQLSGRAGTLQAIAEHQGIKQPEVLKDYVDSHGKYREDAMGAAFKIFDEYNKQGLPIYACSKDTCFVSMDGGFHNYPILMIPGDEITVMGINDPTTFAAIGDNKAPVQTELTVIGVHDNEHGSIVITDGGVFAVGGIGKNIMDQIQRNQEQTFERMVDAYAVQTMDNHDISSQEQDNGTIEVGGNR